MKDYEMEDRPKRSLNPLKFFFSKDAEEGNAVSYTHLTLPTICSV